MQTIEVTFRVRVGDTFTPGRVGEMVLAVLDNPENDFNVTTLSAVKITEVPVRVK